MTFIKSISAVFGFSLIFYIIIPGGLILASDVLLSAASVLDPLHSKKHLGNIWTSFFVILTFQVLFSISVSLGVGISNVFLAQKIESGWIYPASAASSLFLHLFLTAIFTAGFYFVTGNEFLISYALISAVFLLILAPLVGVICTAFTR